MNAHDHALCYAGFLAFIRGVDIAETQERARLVLVERCLKAEADRDTAREMLKNLIADIEAAMGDRYRQIVAEASGDISVNTAFRCAIRDEREASRIELEDARDAREGLK